MKFYYWAYGLKVQSEIEFPEMSPLEFIDCPDVTIKLCENEILNKQFDLVAPYSFKSSENQFSIHIKSIAEYTISNGKNILIYPYKDSILSDMRVYCLSNAFAAVLHQRKLLPLHSAAILKNEKLSLIMGDSGAGKSTLLFHLMQQGWKIFSDDVVIASTLDSIQEPMVSSSYPMMKLWKHQIECMGNSCVRQVRSGVDKFPFYFHDMFDKEKRIVDKIVVLSIASEIKSCKIRRVKGVEVLILLSRQIYRKEYLSFSELNYYISHLSTIATQIPCYELSRPKCKASEKELLDLFISL